ncbi:condensation domain-containing protein [Streptomyces sp. NPDC007205]|uniref:condensation domain-containing protein n=1 Tax=Streptomyces sp. NPDC007205 TaxID=3154316 RepID=UPI0033CF17C0
MADVPLNTATPDSVPLSVNQEAMWVGWQVAPTAPTHVLPYAFAVRGELAMPRLRRAVAALGARHPMLRGRVVADPTGARLTWGDAEPIPVIERAVTGGREKAVLAAAHGTPFDLGHGPLARLEILHGPDYTVLLFVVHHIVFDGTSVVPFLLDLRRAYAGQDLDAVDDLAPLQIAVGRGRASCDGPEGADDRAFWRELLAEPIGRQTLTSRRQLTDGEFHLLSLGIGQELETRVRDLAGEIRASYFTVMFAAFFLMLRHHAGHDDPIVSAPYHGRTDPALRHRVGYFVNVLPFRPRPSGSQTYRDYLIGFRSHVREVLAHHALPLPALLRAASLTGPGAHARTHETVFQYWNTTIDDRLDVRDIELAAPEGACRLEVIDVLDVADYTLTVMLREDSAGSTMVWKDPNGRFGDEMLRRLSDDYLSLLRDMVERPDGTVADGTAHLSPSLSLSEPPLGEPLPSRGGPVPMPDAAPKSPRDVDPEILRAVAAVWEDVLGLLCVAATDSFFELGGHSLLATTLVDRIARRLNVDVALADLFGSPRLCDLAGIVQQRMSERGDKRAAPDDRTGPVPASPFQEGIWLAQRMDPEHARYHVPLSWAVDGPISVAALRAALTDLVARHELLRSGFVERDGRPHLKVLPPWTPDLDEVDIQDAGEAEFDRAVAAWCEAAARTFSVTGGRLLRAALHTGPGGRRTFSLCVHHLVLDGGSVPVFLRELRKCHRARTDVAPRRQYGDLVAFWAQNRPGDAEFWRQRLDGAPSTLDLPAPHRPGPHGRFTLTLPADLTTRLAPVRAEHQVSNFMITACAVAVALHRQTGRRDLTLGFPVAGGRPPAYRDVIGPSMNTLLLRTRCTPRTTVTELLRQVRDEIVAGIAHQDVPFENVVRRMRPPRTPGRTPYLDVLVNSVDQSGWSTDLGTARLTPLAIGDRIDADSKVPVTVTTTVTGDGTLRGSLAYRGDQVDRAVAADLAATVSSLLSDQLSAALKEPVCVLPPTGVEVTA